LDLGVTHSEENVLRSALGLCELASCRLKTAEEELLKRWRAQASEKEIKRSERIQARARSHFGVTDPEAAYTALRQVIRESNDRELLLSMLMAEIEGAIRDTEEVYVKPAGPLSRAAAEANALRIDALKQLKDGGICRRQ